MNGAETIVAIATPAGRGGLGVVRLSGPESLRIARTLVRLRSEPVSHRVRYGHVVDREGQSIDDALVTWFAAPQSYTGEDVVEISTHGAPVILQAVVELALERGARLAHAGEFTERAFLKGRLDLTQAEAVRDLIDASTVAQARLAAEQLGGSLQREVRPAKDALVTLIAGLEAGIDFAEDDLETMPSGEIAERVAALLPRLERLLSSFAHGRLLREGLRLAIVGKPNAGKSSLFNRLLERDRAIVTPVAGTTRDVISERAVIAGVPVELLDTAGLRETEDVVERIGVERSREAMAEADLVLRVVDASELFRVEGGFAGIGNNASESMAVNDAAAVLGSVPAATAAETRGMLTVYNKADLLREKDRAALDVLGDRVLLTSTRTGEGVEELRRRIAQLAGTGGHDAAYATLTNARQRDSIAQTLAALKRAAAAARADTPHEMVLLDLYEALQSLNALTGQTTADDILNQIFSTFCIGK